MHRLHIAVCDIELVCVHVICIHELQLDLDNVCSWASRSQMKFNVSKCKVIHCGKGNLGYNYSMEGVPLEEADCEKDVYGRWTSLKLIVY